MAKQAFLYMIDPATEVPVVVGIVREVEESKNELLLHGDEIAKSVGSDELGTVSLVSGFRFHEAFQQ